MTTTLDRAGQVWSGFAIDAAALADYCRRTLPGFTGPLALAQFHGGASNPTFLLTDEGTGARYVLRRQPAGPLRTSAHAIDREYRVMRALRDTAVPVPAMLAWCDDPAVIGAPFYLMPFIDGRIYRDNRFADMTPSERAAAYDDVADTLAALHAVDPGAVGLADFGRAGSYYAPQVARWTRQYRESATDTIEAMDRVIDRLPARIPPAETTAIVHGDCRQENILFAPDAPRVAALLDWELSTLGDSLADLAFFCLFYHAEFTEWGSAATIDFAATGIPTEAAFVARYCASAGRGPIADWNVYLGFAAFRLAAIAQGVHARALAGTSRNGRDADKSARNWAALAARLLD